MNKRTILAALTTALVSFTGCTISAGTDDISILNLEGYVDGRSWSFAAGHTDAYLSEGEDDFSAALYPSSFTPCGFTEPSGPHLLVSIPKNPGDYDMDFARNITFVGENFENRVSLDGRIVVDEVTATRVRGGLVADYDFDNEVNGQFDVTICARR